MAVGARKIGNYLMGDVIGMLLMRHRWIRSVCASFGLEISFVAQCSLHILFDFSLSHVQAREGIQGKNGRILTQHNTRFANT
jgi:hypothetical protein